MTVRAVADARLVVGALTLIALVVRLIAIDESLFADELFLFDIVADRDLGEVMRDVHDEESTPPLHFLLAWASAKLGEPTVWVRIPSVVAGTATVPLVYLLGARTVGRAAGVAASAVVAIAPFALYYSVEARAYGLMSFLAVLSTLLLLTALSKDRLGWWAGFAACTAALLYTHYAGVFVVVAQAAWAGWAHRERIRALLLAHAAVALAYMLWLPSFLHQSEDSAAARIEQLYPLTPSTAAEGVAKVIPGHPIAPLDELPGLFPAVVFGAAILGAGIVVLLRARTARRPGSRELGLLVALAVATPLGALLYSLGPLSIYLPRNFSPSLPAAALLAGASLTAGRGATRAVVATAALAALAVGTVKALDASYERPPYRVVAHALDRSARAQDPIVDVQLRGGPLGRVLRVHLDRPHPVYRQGHGDASAYRRAARAGRLFFVVPQVGILKGTPRTPELAPFRLVGRRTFHGLVDIAVFTYAPRRPAGG